MGGGEVGGNSLEDLRATVLNIRDGDCILRFYLLPRIHVGFRILLWETLLLFVAGTRVINFLL